jgi:hypothetical protein
MNTKQALTHTKIQNPGHKTRRGLKRILPSLKPIKKWHMIVIAGAILCQVTGGILAEIKFDLIIHITSVIVLTIVLIVSVFQYKTDRKTAQRSNTLRHTIGDTILPNPSADSNGGRD